MTNEYTPKREGEAIALPPVPYFLNQYLPEVLISRVSSYGQACADAARAPLLARIAELEASLLASESMLDNAASKAPEPLRELGEYVGRLTDDDQWPAAERYLNAAALSCDHLRAEVEALTAANAALTVSNDAIAELLRQSVAAIKLRRGGMLWPAVMATLGVGSTVACAICRWAGRDPDTGKPIDAARPAPENTDDE